MDPSDVGSSSRVSLQGPGDWKQLVSIIQKLAIAQNVWDFIDPSKDVKEALAKPIKPTHLDVNEEATNIAALTTEEFRRLEFLHLQYRTKLQGHRDQQKALASIQQYIVKTIGNYYGTIADERDIAKQLSLLQARVQPTDWAYEQGILERYHTVLETPNRSKTEDWITSWQKVLTEARRLGLPDAQGLRPTRQFIQAVSSISPSFTDYWVNRLEDQARTGAEDWEKSFPDGIKISEIFERTYKTTKAAHNKGSFATF
ncbi:Fc.00g035980.m01.CDS01 [Cosmosporella sp. VM-42]